MKVVLLAVFVLMYLSLMDIYPQNETYQTTGACVKYSDFSIVTMASVSCADFERWLTYDSIFITDKVQLDCLLFEMGKLKESDSDIDNLDVRATIEFISENDTMTVCAGRLLVSINGQLYNMNTDFMQTIESLFYFQNE